MSFKKETNAKKKLVRGGWRRRFIVLASSCVVAAQVSERGQAAAAAAAAVCFQCERVEGECCVDVWKTGGAVFNKILAAVWGERNFSCESAPEQQQPAVVCFVWCVELSAWAHRRRRRRNIFLLAPVASFCVKPIASSVKSVAPVVSGGGV